MAKSKKPFFTRSKIWIEDAEGNMVFGSGRLKIFKAIQAKGSINAAAKDLKMGYRAVWARINASEKRLGQPLLIKQSGGSSGGGTKLTPLAETLMEQYEMIQNVIEKETDERFQNALKDHLTILNHKKK